MYFNKKAFASSILEVSIAMVIIGFILTSLYVISADAYKRYNSYRIKNFVMEENNKIQKALAGIRFGEDILFLDEAPLTHPKFSNIIVKFPDEKQIEFRADDLGVLNTNDFTFYNTENEEVYVYNKDIIEIPEFTITRLDPAVNRGGVRIHLKVGANGRTNKVTARLFGNNDYYLDYNIVYTFRNTPQED